MKFHDFIIKLQNLSDQRKKAIIIAVIIILSFIFGFFWLRLSMERLNKIGEVTKDIKLPEIDLPKLELPNNQIQNVEIAEPVLSQVEVWKTYTNEKHDFEFKYPNDWTFEENSIFDSQLNKKILFRYFSKEQNLMPSMNFCQAYPDNLRCEIVKINNNVVNIDWQSGGENTVHFYANLLDGGRVEFYISNFIDTDKSTILKIIYTFKFTK